LEEVEEERQLEELQLLVQGFKPVRIVASDCTDFCGYIHDSLAVLDAVDGLNPVNNFDGFRNYCMFWAVCFGCFHVDSVEVDFLGFGLGLDFVVDILVCTYSFDSLVAHCLGSHFVVLVDLVDCFGIDCCSFVCIGNLGFDRSCFAEDIVDWGIVGTGLGIGIAGVAVVVAVGRGSTTVVAFAVQGN
jgi:hypothetical protein